jgi:hypothetical protein
MEANGDAKIPEKAKITFLLMGLIEVKHYGTTSTE